MKMRLATCCDYNTTTLMRAAPVAFKAFKAFKAASREGTLSYWTLVPRPGAGADAVAAVWFLELLLLFHFEWELNEQHNNTGSCTGAAARGGRARGAQGGLRQELPRG
jgi:hypothetical protein